MRIGVISPHAHKNGTTTLAMLIALELAYSGKLTCITHVMPKSESFFRYLNFKGFADKTSTPSQIVKILREGSLTGDDVRAYCRPAGPDLEAFTNESSNFSQDDMTFMYKYIAKAFPHENVVFDVDDNDYEHNKEVIKLCDVVVLAVTQNILEMDEFRRNREQYLKLLQDKPVVVVVNQYNSTAGNLKEMAKWMGVKKPSNWVVLRENPWIRWATNHGRLNELFRQIAKKDPRVIEVNADIVKICQTIARAKSSSDKKGTSKK